MGVLEDFDATSGEFARLVAAVRLEDLDRPTPCTEWNLRQLLNHVVTGTQWFTTVVRGEEPPDRTVDQILDDPSGAFSRRSEEFRAAMGAPGALAGTYRHPIGDVSGETYTLMRINEYLCHGWDVARTIGEQPRFDDDLARRCRELYTPSLADRPRGPGTAFGSPVALGPDASQYELLLAFFGRDPRPA